MRRQGDDVSIISTAESKPTQKRKLEQFFCEKIGVRICSEKLAHLLYGSLLANFL